MTIDFNDPLTLAAIVAFATSVFKPFLEKLPFARPSSDLHDSSVMLLNILLATLVPLVVAASAGTLAANQIGLYVLQAVYGVAGSGIGYAALTKLGSSVNKKAGSAAAAAAAASAPTPDQVLAQAQNALSSTQAAA